MSPAEEGPLDGDVLHGQGTEVGHHEQKDSVCHYHQNDELEAIRSWNDILQGSNVSGDGFQRLHSARARQVRPGTLGAELWIVWKSV